MPRWVALATALALTATSCAIFGQAEPTPSPEPTPAPATATPQPTPTATPRPSPVPDLHTTSSDVSFRRVRIEITTTSDWTRVEFVAPGELLTYGASTGGRFEGTASGGTAYVVLQPIADANAGRSASGTVDLAVDPSAAQLDLTVTKGGIGASTVRVVAGTTVLATFQRSGSWTDVPLTVPAATLATVATTVAHVPRVVERRALAFYYMWYDVASWSSPKLFDRSTVPYGSDDRSTMEQHVGAARGAGLDGFIASWWGPHDRSDRDLATLLDVALERSFQVSVYIETLYDGVHGRSQADLTTWLDYVISTYGAHPAFLRVQGRPVIFFYATDAVPDATWRSVFADVRAHGHDALFLAHSYDPGKLDVFDGLHQYGVLQYPDPAGPVRRVARGVRYRPILDANAPLKLWVGTGMPGYDDTLLGRPQPLSQPRESGAYYRTTLDAAIATDPDLLIVTSWNEWWESTNIEPSVTFGDLYLRITKERADAWRAMPR